MWGFCPDNTRQIPPSVDYHLKSGENASVDTADLRYPKTTLIFDFCNHKPDFIHVRGKHHTGMGRTSGASLEHNEVAEGVSSGLIE